MGLLIGLWMTVSALSALLVVPAMIYWFKPRFVLGTAAAVDKPCVGEQALG